MLLTKIKLNKSLIPSKIELIIQDEIFYLGFTYNLYDGRVYIDLYDKNDNLLQGQEPVILSMPLWSRFQFDVAGNIKKVFPKALIIPNFADSSRVDNINFSNISDVELYIQELVLNE